jgi:hypothetical protein
MNRIYLASILLLSSVSFSSVANASDPKPIMNEYCTKAAKRSTLRLFTAAKRKCDAANKVVRKRESRKTLDLAKLDKRINIARNKKNPNSFGCKLVGFFGGQCEGRTLEQVSLDARNGLIAKFDELIRADKKEAELKCNDRNDRDSEYKSLISWCDGNPPPAAPKPSTPPEAPPANQSPPIVPETPQPATDPVTQ